LLGNSKKQSELKANVLESMLTESGVGVDPMMAQVLASLRNPEDDPQMRTAIETYKAGNDLQKLANMELGKISDLMAARTLDTAGKKLDLSTTQVPADYNTRQLMEINTNLTTIIRKMGGPDATGLQPSSGAGAGTAPGISGGGVVYASKGQSINFQPKGTDTVPAMLTPGEFVVNRAATQQNLPLLKSINSGEAGGYQKGGSVRYYKRGGLIVGRQLSGARDPFTDSPELQKNIKERQSFGEVSKYAYTPLKTLKDLDTILNAGRGENVKIAKAQYVITGKDTQSLAPNISTPLTDITAVPGYGYKTIMETNTRDLFGAVSVRGPQIKDRWTPKNQGVYSGVKLFNIASAGLPKKMEKIKRSDETEYQKTSDSLIKSLDKYDGTKNTIFSEAYNRQKTQIVGGGVDFKYKDKPSILPQGYFSNMLGAQNEVTATGLTGDMGNNMKFLYTDPDSELYGIKTTATPWNVGDSFGIEQKGEIRYNGSNSSYFRYHKPLDMGLMTNQDMWTTKERVNNKSFLQHMKDQEYEESDESKRIKRKLSDLDYFYDNKLNSIAVDKGELSGEANIADDLKFPDRSYPITLYSENSRQASQWGDIEKFLNEQYRSKGIDNDNFSYYTDARGTISIRPYDEKGQPMLLRDGKHYRWTSSEATAMLASDDKDRFKDIVKKNPFGIKVDQEMYGSEDTRFSFPYKRVQSPIFNSNTHSWQPTDGSKPQYKKYFVIDGDSTDDGVNQNNPFKGYAGDPIVSEDIDGIISMLEDSTPSYNIKSKVEDPAPNGKPFQYDFFTHKMVRDEDINSKATLTDLAENPIWKNALITSNDASFKPTSASFTAKKFEELRKNKIIDVDKSASRSMFEGVDQKEDTTGDIYKLDEAKRITMARSFYDHGVKNNKLDGGSNIENISDIEGVIRTIIGQTTKIPDRLSTPYLEKDAYRRMFVDLFKGEEALDKNISYFNSLGLSTSGETFVDPVKMPSKTLLGKNPVKYYNKWKVDDDNIQTLLNRETNFELLKQFNMKIDDEDEKKDIRESIQDGILYTMTKQPDGSIKKERDMSPGVGSYNEILNKAYNPQNKFADSFFRQRLMNIFDKYIRSRIDENGELVFNDPKQKDILKSDSLLREAYQSQDYLVNPDFVKDHGDALISTLKTDDSTDLDPVTELGFYNKWHKTDRVRANKDQAYLMGDSMGSMPETPKVIEMMKSLMPGNRKEYGTEPLKGPEPKKPETLNLGGVVYASKGQHINFEPRGTDTVPAMLTPGEFVVNRAATQQNLPLLKSINSGATGYSRGGVAYLEKGGVQPSSNNVWSNNRGLFDIQGGLISKYLVGTNQNRVLPDWLDNLNNLGSISMGNRDSDTWFSRAFTKKLNKSYRNTNRAGYEDLMKDVKFRDMDNNTNLSSKDFLSFISNFNTLQNAVNPDISTGAYSNEKQKRASIHSVKQIITDLSPELDVYRRILQNISPDSLSDNSWTNTVERADARMTLLGIARQYYGEKNNKESFENSLMNHGIVSSTDLYEKDRKSQSLTSDIYHRIDSPEVESFVNYLATKGGPKNGSSFVDLFTSYMKHSLGNHQVQKNSGSPPTFDQLVGSFSDLFTNSPAKKAMDTIESSDLDSKGTSKKYRLGIIEDLIEARVLQSGGMKSWPFDDTVRSSPGAGLYPATKTPPVSGVPEMTDRQATAYVAEQDALYTERKDAQKRYDAKPPETQLPEDAFTAQRKSKGEFGRLPPMVEGIINNMQSGYSEEETTAFNDRFNPQPKQSAWYDNKTGKPITWPLGSYMPREAVNTLRGKPSDLDWVIPKPEESALPKDWKLPTRAVDRAGNPFHKKDLPPLPKQLNDHDIKEMSDSGLRTTLINDVRYLKNTSAYTRDSDNYPTIKWDDLISIVTKWADEYDEANNRYHDLHENNWRVDHNGIELPIKDDREKIMDPSYHSSINRYFPENGVGGAYLGIDVLGDRTDVLMEMIKDEDMNKFKLNTDKLIEKALKPDGTVDWDLWKKLNRERINNLDTARTKFDDTYKSNDKGFKSYSATGMDQLPTTKEQSLSRGGVIYASKGSHINFQPKGTDTVPAMLTPGEFVVNRAATQQNLPLLRSINSGAQGYQRGGVAYLADGDMATFGSGVSRSTLDSPVTRDTMLKPPRPRPVLTSLAPVAPPAPDPEVVPKPGFDILGRKENYGAGINFYESVLGANDDDIKTAWGMRHYDGPYRLYDTHKNSRGWGERIINPTEILNGDMPSDPTKPWKKELMDARKNIISRIKKKEDIKGEPIPVDSAGMNVDPTSFSIATDKEKAIGFKYAEETKTLKANPIDIEEWGKWDANGGYLGAAWNWVVDRTKWSPEQAASLAMGVGSKIIPFLMSTALGGIGMGLGGLSSFGLGAPAGYILGAAGGDLLGNKLNSLLWSAFETTNPGWAETLSGIQERNPDEYNGGQWIGFGAQFFAGTSALVKNIEKNIQQYTQVNASKAIKARTGVQLPPFDTKTIAYMENRLEGILKQTSSKTIPFAQIRGGQAGRASAEKIASGAELLDTKWSKSAELPGSLTRGYGTRDPDPFNLRSTVAKSITPQAAYATNNIDAAVHHVLESATKRSPGLRGLAGGTAGLGDVVALGSQLDKQLFKDGPDLFKSKIMDSPDKVKEILKYAQDLVTDPSEASGPSGILLRNIEDLTKLSDNTQQFNNKKLMDFFNDLRKGVTDPEDINKIEWIDDLIRREYPLIKAQSIETMGTTISNSGKSMSQEAFTLAFQDPTMFESWKLLHGFQMPTEVGFSFADVYNEMLEAGVGGVAESIADAMRKKPQNKYPGIQPGYSTGGTVYASKGSHINFQPRGTDTVPAMLTPGEFVVNRASTQQNLPLLKSINSGTYSHGDIVRNLSRGGLSVPRYYEEGTKSKSGVEPNGTSATWTFKDPSPPRDDSPQYLARRQGELKAKEKTKKGLTHIENVEYASVLFDLGKKYMDPDMPGGVAEEAARVILDRKDKSSQKMSKANEKDKKRREGPKGSPTQDLVMSAMSLIPNPIDLVRLAGGAIGADYAFLVESGANAIGARTVAEAAKASKEEFINSTAASGQRLMQPGFDALSYSEQLYKSLATLTDGRSSITALNDPVPPAGTFQNQADNMRKSTEARGTKSGDHVGAKGSWLRFGWNANNVVTDMVGDSLFPAGAIKSAKTANILRKLPDGSQAKRLSLMPQKSQATPPSLPPPPLPAPNNIVPSANSIAAAPSGEANQIISLRQVDGVYGLISPHVEEAITSVKEGEWLNGVNYSMDGSSIFRMIDQSRQVLGLHPSQLDKMVPSHIEFKKLPRASGQYSQQSDTVTMSPIESSTPGEEFFSFSTFVHEIMHRVQTYFEKTKPKEYGNFQDYVGNLFKKGSRGMDGPQFQKAWNLMSEGGYSVTDVMYGDTYKARNLLDIFSSMKFNQGYYSKISGKNPEADAWKSVGLDMEKPENLDLIHRFFNKGWTLEDWDNHGTKIKKLYDDAGLLGRYEMYDRFGKEEFLTTLVAKYGELDIDWQHILKDSLTELYTKAGINSIPSGAMTPLPPTPLRSNLNGAVTEGFANGGLIYARNGSYINFQPKGTDTVPAMLTPGEFVVNRQSTQQNLPVLKAINSGTYSHGDIVQNLSRGGVSVPRYYLNGTNNGVPATSQGPSQGSSQAFDFTSFMNTFKDILKTGLDTLKSLSPQSSGVSDSSVGSMSSIDNFVSRLDKLTTTLASLNIPPEIKITGRHDVNVIINGDTVLNQLKPELAGIVVSSIREAFNKFDGLNPEIGEGWDFNVMS